MPRQARLDAPGTLHHAIIRATEGLEIFRDRKDRENFLSRFPALIKVTGTKILAWTFMDNHVHLLVVSGHQRISKFMRRLLTGYAIYYNRRYQRHGHLFQDRYKSIVCEKEPYLLELVRYIHLNPLRAGIVKNLSELDRYPWSGHGVLVGTQQNDWQEREYVLSQFSDDPRNAGRIYRKFMEEGKDQGRREDLVGGGLIRSYGGWSRVLSLRGKRGKIKHDPRILGRDHFIGKILKEAESKIRRQLRTGEKQKAISKLITDICKKEGIDEQELRNGGQRQKVSRARAMVSYQLSHEFGVSMAEIARNVGVCTSAIIKAVNNLEKEFEK